MSRLAIACLITTLTCTGCGKSPPPITEQPTGGAFGTWKVVAVEGRAPGVTQGGTITIIKDLGDEDVGADKIVVRRLKPAEPPQIDLQFPGEPDAWRGVYELQDDNLRIAVNKPGQSPPEAPRGKPADCVLTLKRQ